MTAPAKDSFIDVERHRLRLEENVAALRKSLRYWQTWEAEYEGLKEELCSVRGSPTVEDLVGIAKNFEGDYLHEGEIIELLGIDKGLPRPVKQVVDLLSRRIEYVHRNVQSMQKQLDAAEERLDSLMIISRPEVRTEEGLPVTEIREELDEDGNVMSSTTSRPSDQAPQVAEALRKAGVPEDVLKEVEVKPTRVNRISAEPRPDSVRPQDEIHDAPLVKAQNTGKPISSNQPAVAKKKVSFAEDPKEIVKFPAPKTDRSLNQRGVIPKPQSHPSSETLVAELEQAEEDLDADDGPEGDTPEEAALRREMLQYSLNEVGSVVAELELEEDSDYSDNDDFSEDTNDDASSIEDEDEHGRTRRQVVTDDYRKKMLELENQLNAGTVKNVGPSPESATLADYASDTRRLVVRGNDNKPSTGIKPAKATGKKGVRFADELDIAPALNGRGNKKENRSTSGRTTSTPVVADIVEERASSHPAQQKTSEFTKRKVSRFKSDRATAADNYNQPDNMSKPASTQQRHDTNPDVAERSNLPKRNKVTTHLSNPPSHSTPLPHRPRPETDTPRSFPEGPTGQIMSTSVIERATSPANVAPPDPEDLDPALLQQEVATEYHRMRNSMIQRQGGFMPTEEEIDEPLYEEVDGRVRKVSRFRAAKLRGLGTG